jgi:hypothetical protein
MISSEGACSDGCAIETPIPDLLQTKVTNYYDGIK